MALEFYRLYEQDNESHYEETYYTVGKPVKPFNEVIREAREHLILRASEGEDVSVWDIMHTSLLANDYHRVEPKETTYLDSQDFYYIGQIFDATNHNMLSDEADHKEAQTILEEANQLRLKHGKEPVKLEELLAKKNEHRQYAEQQLKETQERREQERKKRWLKKQESEQQQASIKEPTRSETPDDFQLDELDQFL